MYFLGIDIGGTSIKYALFHNEALIDKIERISLEHNSVTAALEKLCKIIESKMETINYPKIESIGVGLPGTVDVNSQSRGEAVNISGLKDFDIITFLKNRFNTDVYLDNDGNLTALAEAEIGAGVGFNPVVTITLGTGIGSGIIIDEKIVHGYKGLGAEFGHLVIKPGGRQCNCGLSGCVERYSSASGLIETAKQAADDYDTALSLFVKSGETVTAQIIADYWEKNDALAEYSYSVLKDSLAYALSLQQILIAPEAVILSGGVLETPEPVIAGLADKMNDYLFHKTPPKIIKGKLGHDAGCYGAALLARKNYFLAQATL